MGRRPTSLYAARGIADFFAKRGCPFSVREEVGEWNKGWKYGKAKRNDEAFREEALSFAEAYYKPVRKGSKRDITILHKWMDYLSQSVN